MQLQVGDVVFQPLTRRASPSHLSLLTYAQSAMVRCLTSGQVALLAVLSFCSATSAQDNGRRGTDYEWWRIQRSIVKMAGTSIVGAENLAAPFSGDHCFAEIMDVMDPEAKAKANADDGVGHWKYPWAPTGALQPLRGQPRAVKLARAFLELGKLEGKNAESLMARQLAGLTAMTRERFPGWGRRGGAAWHVCARVARTRAATWLEAAAVLGDPLLQQRAWAVIGAMYLQAVEVSLATYDAVVLFMGDNADCGHYGCGPDQTAKRAATAAYRHCADVGGEHRLWNATFKECEAHLSRLDDRAYPGTAELYRRDPWSVGDISPP